MYVNVASGFKVQETAADLSAAMAIVSAHWDIPVPPGVIAAEEIEPDEILPVTHVLAGIKSTEDALHGLSSSGREIVRSGSLAFRTER